MSKITTTVTIEEVISSSDIVIATHNMVLYNLKFEAVYSDKTEETTDEMYNSWKNYLKLSNEGVTYFPDTEEMNKIKQITSFIITSETTFDDILRDNTYLDKIINCISIQEIKDIIKTGINTSIKEISLNQRLEIYSTYVALANSIDKRYSHVSDTEILENILKRVESLYQDPS